MNTNAMVQSMIRTVRYRNIQGGDWPGKPLNAPAVTLYPNVVAEIDASGMCLWCPAEHAQVSKEILAAVLEDGEELGIQELYGISRLYGCRISYLCAPSLQIIDPDTDKGKARRRKLADLLKLADGLGFWRWKIEYVLSTMNSGEPVTYASYRWAVNELQSAIDRAQHKPRSRRLMEVIA